MASEERSLVEDVKHKQGKYGGFSFGGQEPDGVVVRNPLPAGVVFPNGATAALLLTFDVEGTYGNGVGDMSVEVANYQRICDKLKDNGIPATFSIVGKMAEEQGPEFVEWMLDADCEVATHGYIHELYQRYGGNDVYAGHYGPDENIKQVQEGVDALNRLRPGSVRGLRIPYGNFNEYTYDAIEQAGLTWASNVGIDDFITPGLGFGNAPFQMQLGDKAYPIVEIPLDSQTYDWSIWIADEQANAPFVKAVQTYCDLRKIPFTRTPACGVGIWRQRMLDTIADRTVFTLLCHPINLAVRSEAWGDPVDEFLFPVIEQLGQFHRDRQAWVCTCAQLADFYWKTMRSRQGKK